MMNRFATTNHQREEIIMTEATPDLPRSPQHLAMTDHAGRAPTRLSPRLAIAVSTLVAAAACSGGSSAGDPAAPSLPSSSEAPRMSSSSDAGAPLVDASVTDDDKIWYYVLPDSTGAPGGGVYACPVNRPANEQGDAIDLTNPSSRITDLITDQFRGKNNDVRFTAGAFCPNRTKADICQDPSECTGTWPESSATLCIVQTDGSVVQYRTHRFKVPDLDAGALDIELFICVATSKTGTPSCPSTRSAGAPRGSWCSDPIAIIKRDE